MSKTFRAGRAAAALGVGAAASFFAAYGGVKQAFRYQLDGRVIVITGGSRSLGLAMARQFLRRGAKVALLGRDPETLERARQLLAGKGTVFVRPCDVSNAEQIRAAITDIRQKLGEIDVLVNNAGTITVGPMDSMTADEYRESLEIFFWAAFNAASESSIFPPSAAKSASLTFCPTAWESLLWLAIARGCAQNSRETMCGSPRSFRV